MTLVLICDDEYDIIYFVQLFLGKHGYRVTGASSGAECLEKLSKEKIDIVLLDLMMPKIDGWEVLEKIRSDEKLKAQPVFIFTARYSVEEILDRAIALASDYILKPETSKVLVKKIESFLSETAPSKERIGSLMKRDEKRGKDYEEVINAKAMYKSLLSTIDEILKTGTERKANMFYFQNAKEMIEKNIESCESKIKEIENKIK